MKKSHKSIQFSIILVLSVFTLMACADGGGGGGGGGNSVPVANAGPDQNVATSSLVILDGSGSSDADGDTLTYNWSFTSVPSGSSAALSDPTAVNPTFTAEVDGSYVLSLVVNDGTVDSTADSVTITAVATFNLPDSGQTTCYDAPGNTITCPPPGDSMAQDGSYTINSISSTDNGDGMITDNVTGLIWQKEDDDYTYNWYEATGTAETTYNPDGITDVCGSLTLGGYSDWRLPVKKELMGIVNFDEYTPAIDTTYFPNTNAAYYWSSTTNSKFSEYAWPVSFTSGGFYFSNDKSDENYVRCVRGKERPSNSFTDNDDGTVTDNITGLLWQKESAGISEEEVLRITFIWEEALSYCEELTLAEYSDWRLPNIKELESIVDETKYEPAIDKAYFSVNESCDPDPGECNSSYWSSTSSTSDPDKAKLINCEYGSTSALLKMYAHYYVRCVRGGQ